MSLPDPCKNRDLMVENPQQLSTMILKTVKEDDFYTYQTCVVSG